MVGFLLIAVAAAIPFKLEVAPARLSHHQRMGTRISVKIEGRELAKRRGDELRVDLEIRDAQGQRYPAPQVLSLRDEDYSEDVLLLPGSYTASVTVAAATSGDRATAEKSFHVDGLNGDPLPLAWRNLPAVEYWPESPGLEHWFLPSVTGRLYLPVESKRRVKVDVVMNATPTESSYSGQPNRRVGVMQDENMSALLPTLKAIAQADFKNGSLDISLLDLERRSVVFSGIDVHELNWTSFKKSFEAADPNKIDLQSLVTRRENGGFFVQEVARHFEAAAQPGEPMHVLVILSGPMDFQDRGKLQRIEASRSANCKVFYVRYEAEGRPPLGFGPANTLEIARPRPAQWDSLEATLNPIKPRLFKVSSAMEFRKALAELFAEISKM